MPDAEAAAAPPPQARGATFLHLLSPKWHSMRARSTQKEAGTAGRAFVLGGVGLLFWGFVFVVLYRLLSYFKGIPEIGPLLAGRGAGGGWSGVAFPPHAAGAARASRGVHIADRIRVGAQDTHISMVAERVGPDRIDELVA